MENQKKNHWLHITLLAPHDSSICVQHFILFWYVNVVFFFHHLGKIIIKQLIRAELLLLDREINNTNTYLQHQHFKVLQYACKIRTCITSSLGQRCSCQSNQVSQVYTPRPNLFSFCVTYLRGKYILLFFSFFSSSLLCWNKDLSFKRKRFGGYDPRSQREVVTTHRDHCLHIVYLYSLHTLYTVTSKRAVERRAPQCWCSMGKTPFTVRVLQLVQDAGRSSAIGSVWAWIKAVTETGISDFCLCAAGLRALKGSLFPFSSLLVFFFFFSSCFFKTLYLLKCAAPPLLMQSEGSQADTVGPSHLGLWKCTVQWVPLWAGHKH